MITMASGGYYILLRNSKIMKNISEDENNGARQYLGNYLWLALTLCDSVFILVIWDSLYRKLLLGLQQACCLIFFIVILCFIFSVLLFIIIIVLFFIYVLTAPWPALGHYWGDKLTYSMWIFAFNVRPVDFREPCNNVEPLSLAEYPVGFDSRNFWFDRKKYKFEIVLMR